MPDTVYVVGWHTSSLSRPIEAVCAMCPAKIWLNRTQRKAIHEEKAIKICYDCVRRYTGATYKLGQPRQDN